MTLACPTCSGATDVPDGKGGIMPCPECQHPAPDWHNDVQRWHRNYIDSQSNDDWRPVKASLLGRPG